MRNYFTVIGETKVSVGSSLEIYNVAYDCAGNFWLLTYNGGLPVFGPVDVQKTVYKLSSDHRSEAHYIIALKDFYDRNKDKLCQKHAGE